MSPALTSVEAYLEGKNADAVRARIDLLCIADHPTLLAAFATTKKVKTHRLRITAPEQLDDSIAALLQEAYDEVGPGTRGR